MFKAHAIATIAASNRALMHANGLEQLILTKRHLCDCLGQDYCTFDTTPLYAMEKEHGLAHAEATRQYHQFKQRVDEEIISTRQWKENICDVATRACDQVLQDLVIDWESILLEPALRSPVMFTFFEGKHVFKTIPEETWEEGLEEACLDKKNTPNINHLSALN